ncbi:MAG: hypothetical protein N3F04_03480 [Candidatus Nezhaarchaeota archaeon]|nr:hypothetical protein [Candidatus Nezhaarchaeota archaeon]MCX8141825.1 hypothetical protein [Candidatus Nezhaarchaeota archaeon]MDW8050394.1 hypothetical protein [Nitrososphaerota archaeon]
MKDDAVKKLSVEDVEKDPRLWFKPYCKVCGLLFNDYNEYIKHCFETHWRSKST